MSTPQQLVRLVSSHTETLNHPAIKALVTVLLETFPHGMEAILVYGSCLRSGDYFDGLVDLYVIVEDYRKAYSCWSHRLLNKLLAPNVYYLEIPMGEHVVRAKYAVVSYAYFEKGTSPRQFHPYLWGRFAQPAAIAYVRDTETEKKIYQCLAAAVFTFCLRVVPQVSPRFGAAELWRRGLSLSYGAELRAEKPNRSAMLFDAAKPYYIAVTDAALAALPFPITEETGGEAAGFSACISGTSRFAGRLSWWLRRVQGKPLSLLRLLKGLMTFKGGVNYIIWKLERHSGEKIELTSRVRRYPAIFIWGLFWRLYRRGIFR